MWQKYSPTFTLFVLKGKHLTFSAGPGLNTCGAKLESVMWVWKRTSIA